MSTPVITASQIHSLQAFFGERLKSAEPLSRYSVINIGGPADFLVSVTSAEDLESAVRFLWEEEIPFLLLGGGSNVLISDAGIREVVLINEAKKIEFIDEAGQDPLLWAESGAGLGGVSRRTAAKGWSGLEWASGIPGTIGGAVVNNAGAFGADTADNLVVAEILHPVEDRIQRSEWSVDQFGYQYRTSVIKSGKQPAVVLSATFRLDRSTPEEVKGKISEIAVKRKSSQPGGPSLGSMFKNPPGDYSGRLIEEAGLKGTRIGDVEISQDHANFFINQGEATARDVAGLIALVRDKVNEKFSVELELEIQFIGDWNKEN
jgi:UDP-N-acetylmuramate dehydrogenase